MRLSFFSSVPDPPVGSYQGEALPTPTNDGILHISQSEIYRMDCTTDACSWTTLPRPSVSKNLLKTKHTMKMTKTVSKTIKSLKVLIITHETERLFSLVGIDKEKKQMKETNIPNVI